MNKSFDRFLSTLSPPPRGQVAGRKQRLGPPRHSLEIPSASEAALHPCACLSTTDVRPSSPRISTLSVSRHRRPGQTQNPLLRSCPHLPPAPPDLWAPCGRLTCASCPDNRRVVQAIFRRFPLFFTPTLLLFLFLIYLPGERERGRAVSPHQCGFSFPFHSTSIRLLRSLLFVVLVSSHPQPQGEKGEARRRPGPQQPADRDLCSAQSIHGGTCKALRRLSAVFLVPSYPPPPLPHPGGGVSPWGIGVCCPDRGELAL